MYCSTSARHHHCSRELRNVHTMLLTYERLKSLSLRFTALLHPAMRFITATIRIIKWNDASRNLPARCIYLNSSARNKLSLYIKQLPTLLCTHIHIHLRYTSSTTHLKLDSVITYTGKLQQALYSVFHIIFTVFWEQSARVSMWTPKGRK